MSDVDTAAVETAPEAAPEEVVAPEVQEQPTVETPAPEVVVPQETFKSLADAKRAGREGAREIADRMERERRQTQEQPRDDQGRFAAPAPTEAEGGEPTEAESAPEDLPPTVTQAVTEGAQPEASGELPEGWVRIELDADHPLRQDRGTESIAVPADMENDLRYALKAPVRNREVTELRTKLQELEQAALAGQAEATYWKDQIQAAVPEEDLAKIEADIKQAYPGKVGELMWEGAKRELLSENTSGAEQARQEAVLKAEVERMEHEGQRFVDFTMRDALVGLDGRPARFPGWTQDRVITALKIYGQFLKAEGRSKLDGVEFVRDFAMPMYLRDPAGRKYGEGLSARLQQKQLDEAKQSGLKEAEQKRQAELKEAAERHAVNPTAKLPVNAALSASSTRPAPETDENKGLSPTQLKRKLRGEVAAMVSGS